MKTVNTWKFKGNRESGMTLIESLVAIAIIGTIAVVFLGGLIVSVNASVISDEQSTAESIARGQMEWVQETEYVENATGYMPVTLLSIPDYQNYSVGISAEPLHEPDNGIQKITVTVMRDDDAITSLEGYKRR